MERGRDRDMDRGGSEAGKEGRGGEEQGEEEGRMEKEEEERRKGRIPQGASVSSSFSGQVTEVGAGKWWGKTSKRRRSKWGGGGRRMWEMKESKPSWWHSAACSTAPRASGQDLDTPGADSGEAAEEPGRTREAMVSTPSKRFRRSARTSLGATEAGGKGQEATNSILGF